MTVPALLDYPTARAFGFGKGRLDDLRQRGVSYSPVRGLLVTGPAQSHLAYCRAVLPLLCHTAAFSDETAARLWALPVLRSREELQVVVGRSSAAGPRRGVLVRHADQTRIVRRLGLRLTDPSRTVVDLARRRGLLAGLVAADAAVRQQLSSVSELWAAVAEAGPGRGIVVARHMVELVEPWSESPGETRLRFVLIDGGLPRPEAQIEIRLPGGQLFRGDLGYRAAGLLLEYDGRAVHDDPAAVKADHRRQNLLQAAGWLVLRYRHEDLVGRPWAVVAEVRAALHARMPPVPAR